MLCVYSSLANYMISWILNQLINTHWDQTTYSWTMISIQRFFTVYYIWLEVNLDIFYHQSIISKDLYIIINWSNMRLLLFVICVIRSIRDLISFIVIWKISWRYMLFMIVCTLIYLCIYWLLLLDSGSKDSKRGIWLPAALRDRGRGKAEKTGHTLWR